jgi:hypothetical protein
MSEPPPDTLVAASKASASLKLCELRLVDLYTQHKLLASNLSGSAAASEIQSKACFTLLDGRSTTANLYKLTPKQALFFQTRSMTDLQARIDQLESDAASHRRELDRLPDWLRQAVSIGLLPD